MSQRFTHRSVTWRPPGGHRTAAQGPPSEIICYVDQTATAGTPYGRLWVTARSSADWRPQIVDCNVIARSSNDAVRSSSGHPRCPLGMCCACVLRCYMYYMFIKYIE